MSTPYTPPHVEDLVAPAEMEREATPVAGGGYYYEVSFFFFFLLA